MGDFEDSLAVARRCADDGDTAGLLAALNDAAAEKHALVSAGLAMRHDMARSSQRNIELERALRASGAEIPSASSTPRGGSVTARGSPRVGPAVPVSDQATQTAGVHLELPREARGDGASSAASTEDPPVQSSGRNFSATFVRGTPNQSRRDSRGGTPQHKGGDRGGASSTNSFRGQSAPPDPWASLGESASQVAAHSGRGSPTTGSFRGARFPRHGGGQTHQPLPQRAPAGRPAAPGSDTGRPASSGSHRKHQPRSRGAEALQVILDEYGSALAVGSACVVSALVLYRLLVR